MFNRVPRSILAIALLAAPLFSAHAADPQVERGKYLVELGGCSDCHTPGHFLGHPDMARYLGGSDVGFALPGAGVFVGPNLTPDKATGLGDWTAPQIVTAITTGTLPDGRILAPVMPWRDLANLSHADALAIAAYLKSLPPVSNQVAGPFGPNETPTVFVMSVLPGAVYAGLPKPK
jgi:mono/diheme cytochrome c family protein